MYGEAHPPCLGTLKIAFYKAEKIIPMHGVCPAPERKFLPYARCPFQ
jgi:hypothetical protein